ncbi:MAG: hypothetical protein NTX22_07445 [Ignavibacteriales bacterium]|nr:hypothetical protein [Ignavibacteriales bacterium]
MIRVSISSSEEKYVIQLRHKIDYVIEKKFKRSKSLNKRTVYVFVQLFLSITKLIFLELFAVALLPKTWYSKLIDMKANQSINKNILL